MFSKLPYRFLFLRIGRLSLNYSFCHCRCLSTSAGMDGSDSVQIATEAKPTKEIVQFTSTTDGTIKEGRAEILKDSSKNVFYNPVQEFNRDLSVLVLSIHAQDHFKQKLMRKEKENHWKLTAVEREEEDETVENNEAVGNCSSESEPIPELVAGKVYEDGMVILEALAATGLRSIRYAKEVPGVRCIVANDLSPSALESLTANIAFNKVDNLVTPSHGDASMVMYQHRHQKRFDVVDLDPYGCPSQFLDGAVQAVASGGMLMVTCTDMAVLAGNSPETCYSKYGAISLRNKCCHEMALRIALQCIESHANRYGRYITPLLSVSADFYIRLFVRVQSSPSMCKRSINKLSMVYQCVGCQTLTLQPLGEFKNINPNNPKQMKMVLPHVPSVTANCPHCDSRYHLGGPIWNAPIHDKEFVSRLLDVVLAENAAEKFGTHKRIEGMLSVIEEELEDVPLYYKLDRLSSLIGTSTMPAVKFSSAILNAGYRISQSHCQPICFKTDAPQQFIWDVLRLWEKDNPISEKRRREGTISSNLLSKPISFKVDFSTHPDANPESKKRGKCRYQLNPSKYWGPGVRSIANLLDNSIQDKQKRNQGKNSSKKRKYPTEEEQSVEESKRTQIDEEC